MFVALVLMGMGAVLFEMRTRLKAMEAQVALLEGVRPRPWAPVGATRVVERAAVAEPLSDPEPEAPSFEQELASDSVRPELVEGSSLSSKEEGEEGASTGSARTEVGERTLTEASPDAADQAAPDFDEPARPGPKLSFEELFGRRLPIWAGGVTLAVAGVLLVKYSIDAGLLSPVVRVVLGLLFGTTLIGAAEVALRQDPRRHCAGVRRFRPFACFRVASCLEGQRLQSG